jgi:AcrR family transcriptional regulator
MRPPNGHGAAGQDQLSSSAPCAPPELLAATTATASFTATPAATTSAKPRRYRGQSPEERRVDRRRRLLHTGLELFGTVGYQQTSVERLCSASGVTGRHFYEEFASREALLAAVYDEVMTRCVDAAVAAVDAAGPGCDAVIEAGVGAYVRAMLADRRAARVATIEVMAVSGAVDASWRRQCLRFADYMLSVGNRLIDRGEPIDGHDITPIALVGAIHELIRMWTIEAADHQAGDHQAGDHEAAHATHGDGTTGDEATVDGTTVDGAAAPLSIEAVVDEATRVVRRVARTPAH